MLIRLAITIVILAQAGYSQKCLKTNGAGPMANQACVFPFRFRGKTFDSCTSASDPDGKFWCSTKVDGDKNHLQGNWGYCDRDCEEHADDGATHASSNEIIRCTKTNRDREGQKEKACIFPFVLDGKLLTACTNSDQEDKSKFWCPTRVDQDKKVVPGEWGFCDRDCKSDPGLDSDVLEFVNLDQPDLGPRSGLDATSSR